jgi:predicted nucleic acid-binding Zn ribbon protein
MKPIASILPSIFRDSPHHQLWVVACLEGSWQEIVGDGIARICRPSRLDNSNLVLEILDPSWEGTLKGMERDLLEKIRQFAGNEVKRLSFRVLTA